MAATTKKHIMLFPLTKLGWMTEKFECLARGYLLF